MEYDRRRVAVQFAVAIGIAAALLYGVGWERVLANLRGADAGQFAVACTVSLAAMVVGSEGVRLTLDLPVRGSRATVARLAYLGASFIRSFIPAGNVGGSTFVAYAVSRDDDSVGESVAGVAGWEFLNMVASAVVASVGVVGVATGGGSTGAAPLALAVFAGTLALAAGGLLLVANHRDWVADRVLWAARVGRRVLPFETATLSRERVHDGLDRFFDAVEEFAADRPRLVLALVLAHLGWLFGCLVLYFCLHAVSLPVAVPVVLLAVPLSGFALAIPIPGGIGPTDAALGGVVAFLTGYGIAALASALVLYRVATYVLHIVVGGAALWLLDRRTDGLRTVR